MQHTIYFFSEGYRLRGVLHLPETENPPVVIGSHGLFSTGDSPKQTALAEQCLKRGMAFFRFDHRGCGRSDGDFAIATTFEGRCRDLVRAVEVMQARPEIGKHIGLFGSSFGGAVCLSVAAQFEVKAIVTVAAPLSSGSIRPPDVNDPANSPLIENLDKAALFFDLGDSIQNLSRLLIFHGDRDAVVPFSNALELYAKASEPKRLIRQAGGAHSMSDPGHQKEFTDLAAWWFEKHLLF
ncbi:MAG: alpha/beta fold hydrolase [Desulfosalsimonadaceae bacterium]